jgi:hypothetical protein
MIQVYRITNNTPVVVVTQNAYIFALLISCAAPGSSAMKLHIQNGEAPAKVLVPPYTLKLEPSAPIDPPNPREFEWINSPRLMAKGIKIQAVGAATDADVSVWIDYETVGGPV